MGDLLTRFNEREIQNKDDLLFSLRNMFEDLSGDDSAPQSRKELLEKFIRHIETIQLPRCDDWWFYSYDFTRFGMALDMCHCADFVANSDDEATMTIDISMTIAEVACDMISVAEFAKLHHVKPVSVRQWIRRGKLRAIKKHGRDWLISSIAEKPSRNYKSVRYEWDSLDAEIYEMFPFLKGVQFVHISQSHGDKKVFIIKLGDQKQILLNTAETQKLELALLAIDDIEVEETDQINFVKCNENHDNHSDLQQTVEISAYGPVAVIGGRYKGRIGLYDDEESDRYGNPLAIVYFGSIILPCKNVAIPFKYLSSNLTTYKLIERTNEITRELWKNPYDVDFQKDRLHELHLCSTLLENRYINAKERMKIKENHKIFISHSSHDLHFARALATDLINDGFSVFLDDWSIDLGENIVSRISEEIEESHSLIMLISEDYVNSTYCSDEWTAFYMRYSKIRKDSIYPILLDSAQPPALLSAIKYARIDDMENYEEVYLQLLTAIRKHSEKAVL